MVWRRGILIMLFFAGPIICTGQDDSAKYLKNFKLGAGSIGYMNNLFIPAGMRGITFSPAYHIEHSGLHNNKIINENVILRFDYARLSNNKKGEQSLDHPTEYFNINISGDRLFRIKTKSHKSAIYIGPVIGLNAGLCLNTFYTFETLYYTPLYNEWSVFSGISLLMNYNVKRFTFENRFQLPVLMVGRWPEYGRSQETRSLKSNLRSAEINTVLTYLNAENSFTVFFNSTGSGSQNLRLFLGYNIIRHSSEIDHVKQNFLRNTIYIGIQVSTRKDMKSLR